MTTKGITIKLQTFWSPRYWSILYHENHLILKTLGFFNGLFKRFIILFRIYRYDFVFIHREALPLGPPLVEWWICKVAGKKIIYDFDDAIWLPNTSRENNFTRALKYHQKVGKICSWSHKISCGNRYLQNFSLNFNTNSILNPTTIDPDRHQPATSKNSEKIIIGWTGTHSTIKYLKLIAATLQKLSLKRDFDLVVISDKPPSFNLPNLKFVKWQKETEIEDLQQFHIGVMPLTQDPWADGKCGFKILQYMALGIPAVASPVGVNSEIIQSDVNGFLCKNDREWIDALILLIDSSSTRERLGTKGREIVVKKYSVQSNSANFLSLFSANNITVAST